MVVALDPLQHVPTMVEAILRTITTSMVLAQDLLRHVQTMVEATLRTITTSMVVVQDLLQHVQTMVVAILRTIITSMVAVQVVQRHVLIMMEVQLPITMTNMVAASARQLPGKTMVVEPQQPFMMHSATALVPVSIGESVLHAVREKKASILFMGAFFVISLLVLCPKDKMFFRNEKGIQ